MFSLLKFVHLATPPQPSSDPSRVKRPMVLHFLVYRITGSPSAAESSAKSKANSVERSQDESRTKIRQC